MHTILQAFLTSLPQATWAMGASFTRMVLAYGLSLIFAIVYGYFAATNKVAEKVLLPILDILQSVPILGFFPVAIVFFVELSPGLIGPNLASIFLIFTSMSWNMAFGVYESLKTVPGDLGEVANSLDIRGFRRLRRLLVPAMANRLIYNSVLSWSVGWYFLVSAEIISTAGSNTVLPGIGSFLLVASATDNSGAILAGIIVLVTVIVLLNFLLWRPLGHLAERYRYDTAPSGATTDDASKAPFRRMAPIVGRAYARGVSMVRVMALPFSRFGGGGRSRPLPSEEVLQPRHHRSLLSGARYIALGITLIVGWLIVIALSVAIFSVYTHPISPLALSYIKLLPEALGLSAARILVAYALCVAISFPLALYIFRNTRASRWGLPVIQIVASVPATALFPLFLFSLQGYIGTQSAVIFVIVTGSIWYVFFNILSGLRTIPPDLEEGARALGLKGKLYYKRLIFPGVFPSFVTGSITAIGGAWNTLIIAEYLPQYGHKSFQVLGLGYLIDLGVYNPPSGIGFPDGIPLMVAALLTLTVTVVAVNKFVWKPIYRLATERYRYD